MSIYNQLKYEIESVLESFSVMKQLSLEQEWVINNIIALESNIFLGWDISLLEKEEVVISYSSKLATIHINNNKTIKILTSDSNLGRDISELEKCLLSKHDDLNIYNLLITPSYSNKISIEIENAKDIPCILGYLISISKYHKGDK